ncbi:uncharacterized protein LOC124169193 [Ischnura elegans]|uniref:uncharacterized protein LOC124169193 n=1 Tax=Ischnura elegans TaxID=197161 RepID=UPI001ED8B8FC|nr:uncharacterized protein LOC124169193 [Ischnura elegans]
MGGLSWIYYLAALTCLSSTTQGNIFGRGREAIYSYTADVRAGTVDPTDYASQFGIKGTLTIQSNNDGSAATFKLSGISTQAYNGPLSLDDEPESKFLQAPPEIADLEEPFEVIYRDGLVQTIFSKDESESSWALNVKKSIATIFQLDMKNMNFDKSTSFISEEKSIFGRKMTENVVLAQKKGHAILRKTLVAHPAPSHENVYDKWENLDGLQCSHKHHNTLDTPQERIYELIKPGDSIVIDSAKANGKVTFSPYSDGGFSQYIDVKQEFRLKKQTKMNHEYQPNPGKEHSPLCTYAVFDEKQGTRVNSAGEKAQPKKDSLVPMVHKRLQELLDAMEEVKIGNIEDRDSFLGKQRDRSHFASFWLLKILGYADYETLKSCFSTIGVGTSIKDETIRELFLDVLSQVGTRASISLLTDLILSQSLKEDSAVQVLKTIPFYARQIDVTLLEKYESVLGIEYNDQVKRAATLSFATLIHRGCKHNRCAEEVLDKYVLKYFELFKGATEYQWQMNYLEGLSNIEVGKVVEYLEPIIKGDQPHSHHIRFLAMWATRLHAIQDPKRVLEVYWPILEDKTQHLELRVGAFVILLLSKPLQDRFNSLASIMAEEPEGSHLYYFFYTTMQSLAGTKHPCYQIMKKPALNVLQYARAPKPQLWTGNHISDYVDPDNHYGGLLQLFMVAHPNTGGPNVLYFVHNDHFLGKAHDMFSIYVKIRGIRSPNLELQTFEGQDKLGKLQQLLSSFNINEPSEKDEPVHVELIVQFQGRAIMTHYYNETNYHEMFSTLKSVGAGFGSAFHINYQRLMFPLINEITGPTDLGVPMALRIPIPFMFSLQGNFTVDVVDAKLSRKVQIDMKYWRNGGAFLAVYNPIGQLWHGVSRLHTTLLHLPMNYQATLDILQKKAQIVMSGLDESVLGFAVHAGSNVFVEALLSSEDRVPKALLASCETCDSHVPVMGNRHHQKLESANFELENVGVNLIFRYFDCDISNIQFYMEYLVQLLTDESSQHVSEKFSDEYLNVIYPLRFYDYLAYFPISGRCGFVLKAVPTGNTKGVVINAQFIPDDSKGKEKERITSEFTLPERYYVKGSVLKETSIGEVTPAYDYSLNYQMSEDASHYFIKVKFGDSDNYSERLKMCLDAEVHYPEPPIDPLRQRDPREEEVTGALNLVYGPTIGNKCPKKGFFVKVAGRAVPVPDKSQSFYTECNADRDLEEWAPELPYLTPHTSACMEAAIDSTTLRRYEFTGEATEELVDLASKSLYAHFVMEGTTAWGEYIVNSSYSKEDYPLIKDGNGFVVEFAPDGILLIDTLEDGELDRSVFNTYPSYLYGSRFPLASNNEDEVLDRTCMLTGSTVTALDESSFSHEMSSCYTLAFGHCHMSSPLFAGLVRKIEGTHLMALKFYNLGHYVELVPHMNNSVEVLLNGENINFKKEDGFKFEDGGNKIFRIWQRASKKERDGPLYLNILGETTNVMVEYTGGRMIAKFTHSFIGKICGVCNTADESETSRWETCEHQ